MYRWYLCVCALATGVYINTLTAGFVYDDNRAIISNPDIRTSTPLTSLFLNDFWGTPVSSTNSHGSYRPLCVLTFRLNYWLGGLRPLGYHLVNVLLHSTATALVLHSGGLILPGRCSAVAAAMFAVHPVHTEAVAGVVGRADLLASVFFLLTFIMYFRYVEIRSRKHFKSDAKHKTKHKSDSENVFSKCNKLFDNKTFTTIIKRFHAMELNSCLQYVYLVLSLCFSVCAILCKETGVTVLGVCAVYEILVSRRSKKNRPPGLLVLATTGVSIISLRLLLRGLSPPTFSSADNPTAHDPSLLTRTLTFLYLPLVNVLLLFYPKVLSFDWSMEAVQRINTLLDARNILTVSFYTILYLTIKFSYCKLRKTKNENLIKQKLKCVQCHHNLNTIHTTICRLKNNNNAPSTCACPMSSQKRFTTHECLLLCIAFTVWPFLPATNLLFYVGFVVAERVLYLPSVGYCFIFALGLNVVHNKINKRLSSFVLCYLLLTHASRTWQRNDDWKDEVSLYRSGIPVNPPKAYGNLGSVLSSQGKLQEAEECFRLALNHRPNMADVHYNLGNLQAKLERYSDAIHSYEMAIAYRPSLAVSYLNLGHLLESLGRHAEAEQVLLKCTKLEAIGLKDVHTHQRAQASALLTLSRMYFERGQLKEAVDVYREAAGKGARQDTSMVFHNSQTNRISNERNEHTPNPDCLRTTMRHGKTHRKNNTRLKEEAYDWFQLAPLLALKDPLVYMHYGKHLVDSGRYQEAVSIYQEAAQLGTDQYNVVTSAAAALRHAGRYEEAEIFYRKAVVIRPKDSTSLSNLGAILHLKGNRQQTDSNYKEAEMYYREALKINPADETALVNLGKLRNWLKRSIT